jgi:3-hydroxyacyl-CoA dehydrogenase/enoyl-CoA hydratase/3-hydroxybutyryl-CoA epimerase
VQQLGKLPVVVQDSPGFLVNRILMPYLIEAGRLFESGARIEDIDQTMLDFGMPMGPLRLIDEVGVDVAQHVSDTLNEKFAARLQPPALLRRMLEAKLLGRKVGRGFYLYGGKGKDPAVNPQVEKLQNPGTAANLNREQLQDRMVFLMVNEAARCLEEKIVASAEDVDFGMIMGTGFSPFLGGPLRFADHVGIPALVREMTELPDQSRFAPCDLLRQMAQEQRTFYPKGRI